MDKNSIISSDPFLSISILHFLILEQIRTQLSWGPLTGQTFYDPQIWSMIAENIRPYMIKSWSSLQSYPNGHIISTFRKGKNHQIALILVYVPIKHALVTGQSVRHLINPPPSILILPHVHLKSMHPFLLLSSANAGKTLPHFLPTEPAKQLPLKRSRQQRWHLRTNEIRPGPWTCLFKFCSVGGTQDQFWLPAGCDVLDSGTLCMWANHKVQVIIFAKVLVNLRFWISGTPKMEKACWAPKGDSLFYK